jgi:hypothetical protein
MQNQSSPVQILSPVIPKSWCPEGTWSDVFNSYNQLFLNNSTINIPFLNQVSPQQITELQQSLLTIQNTLDAVTPQTGTITSLASAGTLGTYVVTFPTAMPDANYTINITFVATATPTTADMSWSLLSGSKTTTGFTFYSLRASTDNVSQIIWSVANISAL